MTQRDKIKPIVDVPLIFQLEQVYGQEVPSKFEQGIEYRFSVVFEERPAFIYLPSSGRDAILQARPDAGDFIELLKQKRNNQVWFRAQVLSDANDQPAPPPPQQQRRVNGAAPRNMPEGAYYQPNYEDDPFAREDEPPRNGQRHSEDVAPYRQPEPPPRRAVPPPPPPPRQLAAPPQQQTYAGQAMPPRPEAVNISPIAQQLAGCLRVSIDAWEEAVAYARSKGCNLEYTSEDVRAVGLSFYINAIEKGFFNPRRNGNGNGGRR